jgi:hypothetical protein
MRRRRIHPALGWNAPLHHHHLSCESRGEPRSVCLLLQHLAHALGHNYAILLPHRTGDCRVCGEIWVIKVTTCLHEPQELNTRFRCKMNAWVSLLHLSSWAFAVPLYDAVISIMYMLHSIYRHRYFFTSFRPSWKKMSCLVAHFPGQKNLSCPRY